MNSHGKIWLTVSQRALVERALKAESWELENVGCRDDLELLEEHGILETRRKRGMGFIAFRVPDGTKVLEADGYHFAVRSTQ